VCCPTVVICAILSTVVAQLVLLRWCLAVVYVVFSSFYDYFFVLLCRLLSLFECCLIAWLLGAVMLYSRVVGTGLVFNVLIY
jgi:hypothetical protein